MYYIYSTDNRGGNPNGGKKTKLHNWRGFQSHFYAPQTTKSINRGVSFGTEGANGGAQRRKQSCVPHCGVSEASL